MNISELIQKLSDFKEKHGDLQICVPGEHYDTWNTDSHLFLGFKQEEDVWGFELACCEDDYNNMTDQELYNAWLIEDRSTLQKVLMIG